MSCDNPTPGSQLANACSCKTASESLSKSLTDYETALATYVQKNADNSNRQQKRQDWENLVGNFSDLIQIKSDLKTEAHNWNSCMAWSDTSPGHHNDWCEHDVGQGWYHAGQDGGGCTKGFGKGVCKRTQDQVERDFAQSHNNRKPEADLSIGAAPSAPTGNNIQCCSQLFSGISGASVQFSDIQQKCTQQIESQIANASKPPPPTINPPTINPPPINQPTDSSPISPQTDSPPTQNSILTKVFGITNTKRNEIITFAVIIIICCLIISSSILLMVMSSGQNNENDYDYN